MEMLLAILLWIGCISSPNTYYQAQIDSYSTQHQQVVDSAMSNQVQREVIWQQYGIAATELEVIDPYN